MIFFNTKEFYFIYNRCLKSKIFPKNTMVDNTLSFQKQNASVKFTYANGQLVKSATISAQNANVDVLIYQKVIM